MPINATPEYFKAEEKFHAARSKEEKITALEEMIRLCPKHKGTENLLAQHKAKLAKLKKEGEKKSARKVGIQKEGDAQVCIIGLTNSGKSWLLSRLTNAKPLISSHPYTTTKPEVGMMDYKGVKIQLVEIPSTFEPEYMSIARSAEALAIVVKDEGEVIQMEQFLADNYIRTRHIFVSPWEETPEIIKENIWHLLSFMIAYTKLPDNRLSPMALPKGATVKDFAQRIHKDFIKNFHFARIIRKGRVIQAGLDYKLEDSDIVKLYLK
jgi:ribosome-interacting GTPase 1